MYTSTVVVRHTSSTLVFAAAHSLLPSSFLEIGNFEIPIRKTDGRGVGHGVCECVCWCLGDIIVGKARKRSGFSDYEVYINIDY